MVPGDIDQHIDAAELRDALRDGGAAGTRVRNVDRHRRTPGDIAEHPRELCFVPCDTENRCTHTGKQPRGFRAQARRCPRYEGDLALKCCH